MNMFSVLSNKFTKIGTVILLALMLGATISGCTKASEQAAPASTQVSASAEATTHMSTDNAAATNSSDVTDDKIVYDNDSLTALPTYENSKVVQYFLGSDGAYSEGAIGELAKRFLSDPATILNEIAKLNLEQQKTVCFHIGAYYPQDEITKFEEILSDLKKQALSDSAAATLALFTSTYQDWKAQPQS